jgi:non-ribosomal peptide synthetase component F
MNMTEFKSVLDVVEHTAERFPERVAAIDPEGQITWSSLVQEAKLIANRILSEVGLQEEGYPVAVFSEKSIHLLESILGINYAGAFYTYINPEQPADRIAKILEVLEPKAVLVEDGLLERFAEVEAEIPVIPFSDMKMEGELVEQERAYVNRETPLYGIFTSGSTGTPKCVLIAHGSAMDFISHFVETFGFTESDVIGNQAPFDFDVSIKDIVTAYFTGASLVLIPREYFSTPARLLDYICDNHVTNLTWAVSALCIIS